MKPMYSEITDAIQKIASHFSPFFDDCSHSNIEDIEVCQPDILTPLSEATAGGKIPTNDSRDIIKKSFNPHPAKNTPDNG